MPRLIAFQMCTDGSNPAPRLHLNPDVYDRGHAAQFACDYWGMKRWGPNVDEIQVGWPWGATPIGTALDGTPLQSGAYCGDFPGPPVERWRTTPIGPRQAERMGDGPGRSVSGFAEGVAWLRSHFPRLAVRLYANSPPVWWREGFDSWCPEAVKLRVGFCLDAVGLVPSVAPFAQWIVKQGCPVSLEGHAPTGRGDTYKDLDPFPRESFEDIARKVENGLYERATENVVYVTGGSNAEITNRVVRWFQSGRWSVKTALNSTFTDAQLGRMYRARDGAAVG